MPNYAAKERKLKAELKRIQEEKIRAGQSDKEAKKAENKRKQEREQENARRRREEKKARNIELQEQAIALKQQKKEERHKKQLQEAERSAQISIKRLKREVVVEFDHKSVLPAIKAAMGKYGEIEKVSASPIGLQVRYKNANSAKKAVNAKDISTKLTSVVVPAEIKHHAVWFEAPEGMGELDDDLLSQVESAMGGYGNVVRIKKKGRCVILFFDNAQSAKELTSNEGNDVTIEIGGYTVALHSRVPPTARQRRTQNRMEKEALQREQRKEALRKKKQRRHLANQQNGKRKRR